MSSSESEFAELLNLLVADRHRGVPGDLSPYISRLATNGTSTLSNIHSRDEHEAIPLPAHSGFPFTFKQMIHTLYDAGTWAEKVKDVIDESKSQFKPLPEDLKSPRLSGREPFSGESSQIRTIKKRCSGRIHISDPVFVPKPTYVSHHTRTSTVDLHIEGRKSDSTPSPTKRRFSQSRPTRPTLTLNTGVRRPRHQSLTQLDAGSTLWGRLTPFSDSEDSELDAIVTPTDITPISPLPPSKIPKRSSTISAFVDQPSTSKGHLHWAGRVRSSSFCASTYLPTSSPFQPFEPGIFPMEK